MVVQPLGRQHLGELALRPARLLDLGPLVLKPNLDLVLVEAEVLRKALSPLFGQVSVLLKLPLESGQLL